MVEITQQARDIMIENARAGGKRGGPGRNPFAWAIDVKGADAQQGRRGIVQRVRETLDVWMGPGQPLPISAPDGTPARSWDFPLFYNYSLQPDAAKASESGVAMYQLKLLAQQTHVALVIEKLSNKIKKKRWTFGLQPLPGEKSHEAAKRAANDPRIPQVANFFRCPDGENELPEWLGMNLHNMLVCGVTSIVPWRKVNGSPFRLEVYDPATIIPKLDEGGRRPMGLDADGKPRVAFQQFIKGVPFQNFGDADMLWYGPNPVTGKVYPVGPTEKLLLYINIALRKDAQRLAHYTDGNIAAGLLPMPPEWTPDQISKWYTNFNLFLMNLPENMAKMVPIPYAGSGAQPIFPQLESLKDQWEESFYRLVAGFYGIPVSSLVKEMTKANAEGNRQQADEEGEQYYEEVMRRFINRCVLKFYGYSDIVARTEAEVETDLETQSKIDIARVGKGLDQPNEIRERDGKEPIQALIGKEGYFDAKGNFMTFDAAIAASESPDPDVLETPDDGEDPERPPTPDGTLPPPTRKLAKAQKKNSQRFASRTSTRKSVAY